MVRRAPGTQQVLNDSYIAGIILSYKYHARYWGRVPQPRTTLFLETINRAMIVPEQRASHGDSPLCSMRLIPTGCKCTNAVPCQHRLSEDMSKPALLCQPEDEKAHTQQLSSQC